MSKKLLFGLSFSLSLTSLATVFSCSTYKNTFFSKLEAIKDYENNIQLTLHGKNLSSSINDYAIFIGTIEDKNKYFNLEVDEKNKNKITFTMKNHNNKIDIQSNEVVIVLKSNFKNINIKSEFIVNETIKKEPIKAKKNLFAKDLDLTKNIYQIIDNKIIDKDWVLKNKINLFNGSLGLINNINDIEELKVEPIYLNDEIKLEITISKNKVYDYDEKLIPFSTTYIVSIKGFRENIKFLSLGATRDLDKNISLVLEGENLPTSINDYIIFIGTNKEQIVKAVHYFNIKIDLNNPNKLYFERKKKQNNERKYVGEVVLALRDDVRGKKIHSKLKLINNNNSSHLIEFNTNTYLTALSFGFNETVQKTYDEKLINKDWVLENKYKLFQGYLEEIDDINKIKNINIVYSRERSNEIILEIELDKNSFYDEFGYLNEESKLFKITISDFKKSDKTSSKQNLIIEDIDSELQKFTVEESKKEISKEWIFNNKHKLFDGDLYLFKNENDIDSIEVLVDPDWDTRMILNIYLKKGTSYDKEGFPTNEKTYYSISIDKFVEPFYEWDEPIYIETSNSKIKDYYKEKYDNFIIKSTGNAKVIASAESYQQKTSLEPPVAKYDFSLNLVKKLSKENILNIINHDNFIKKFNSNTWIQPNSFFKYSVDSWSAIAKKRYTGNVVIIPTYANEVKHKWNEKTYENWTIKNLDDDKDAVAEIINNLIPFLNLENGEETKLKKSLNDFKSFQFANIEKFMKLKPIITNKNINTNIKYVDFGSIKIKKLDMDIIQIESNNLLPIVDYISSESCGGATCSHNNRTLVDVILTALGDFVLDVLGNIDYGKLFSSVFIKILYGISNNFNYSGYDEQVKYYEKLTPVINNIANYVRNNAKRVLFKYFGKVEKTGLQLGKCGHLISGIRIRREDNKIIYNNFSSKSLTLFSSERNIFIDKNKILYDRIHSVQELNNYKKLFNYFKKQNINNEILEILINNITNLSLPSKEIYNQFINYIEKSKKPKRYIKKLSYFETLLNDGIIIPSNILEWDELDEKVAPQLLKGKL